jgi:hypothetical protein
MTGDFGRIWIGKVDLHLSWDDDASARRVDQSVADVHMISSLVMKFLGLSERTNFMIMGVALTRVANTGRRYHRFVRCWATIRETVGWLIL